MSVIPEDKREKPEIAEGKNTFVIDVSHDGLLLLWDELESLLGLHLVPLIDTRHGLEEVETLLEDNETDWTSEDEEFGDTENLDEISRYLDSTKAGVQVDSFKNL